VPATDSDNDHRAATLADGFDNRWFLNPVFGQPYPADVIEALGKSPQIVAGDMTLINQPMDFLGVNFYFRQTISSNPQGSPLPIKNVRRENVKRTAMDWEVHAPAFEEILTRIHRDYKPQEIYITENGSAWNDIMIAGEIDDQERISYLQSHLEAMFAAEKLGAPIRGYFAWSFMDNFEWAYGYDKRFGLVYVDYNSQKRTPKKSAHFYRDLLLNRTTR
jgi:beta-glucosidase